VLALAAASLATAPATASAAEPPPRVSFSWKAPKECPDEAYVRGEIERLLRRPLEAAAREPLAARARVSRDKRGVWHMKLDTKGPAGPGERTLEGDTCEGLGRATALIVALAIDPAAVAEATTGSAGTSLIGLAAGSAGADGAGGGRAGAAGAAGEAATGGGDGGAGGTGGTGGTTVGAGDSGARGVAATPGGKGAAGAETGRGAATGTPGAAGATAGATGPTAAPDAPAGAGAIGRVETDTEAPSGATLAVRIADDAPLRLLARVTAGGDFGTLPHLAPGGSVAVGLLTGTTRVEVVGSYWLPQRGRLAGSDTVYGTIRLYAAGLRGCAGLHLGAFDLPACFGAEVGRLYGKGHGVSTVADGDALWLAATAGAAVAWNLAPWLALWLQADAVAPLLRPEFVFDSVAGTPCTASGCPIWRPLPVSARAAAGVELHFP
jgi:hypothetical protein